MKIGIIVFSQTGNTLSVAQKLEETLKSSGHTVKIEKIIPADENPKNINIKTFLSVPDVGPYDIVIFASPVQGLTLAPVMKQYLSQMQISSLDGKKVYCFVTQYSKKAWLGGNRAVRCITALCKTKGADILSSGIVNWSSDARGAQIDDIVGRLGAIR